MHLLLTFEDGYSEQELIELAKKSDIRVYGMSDYRVGEENSRKATILLGYANLSEEQIKEAARTLCKCWGSIEECR